MHDIRYDPVHDEILVTNPFALALLVFRGGATGEEAPVRVIQGLRTQLIGSASGGSNRVYRLEVDPIHNEILVPNGDSILVFPREASGDVAPVRVIRGAATQLTDANTLAVDPMHDLIVVGDEDRPVALKVFNRTDNGNVKPRAIIAGPKTGLLSMGQIATYPPKGWILVCQPGKSGSEEDRGGVFLGVWSVFDNGDVPPRWKIGEGKGGLKRPRGVTFDPKHREVMVADMRLNAILTFYFPEIF
jgi:hypothetical protein